MYPSEIVVNTFKLAGLVGIKCSLADYYSDPNRSISRMSLIN